MLPLLSAWEAKGTVLRAAKVWKDGRPGSVYSFPWSPHGAWEASDLTNISTDRTSKSLIGTHDIQQHIQHLLNWKVESQASICSVRVKSVELEVSMVSANSLLVCLASFINPALKMMFPCHPLIQSTMKMHLELLGSSAFAEYVDSTQDG